jgi:dihydrofolate reductase
MAKLIYSANVSLDGYVADQRGSIDFTAPDEEVLAFINDRERQFGTYLFGRRMYETLVVWETLDTSELSAAMRDFAQIWHAAEKVVYSRTLPAASASASLPSAKTRLEPEFDPDAIRALKESSTADLSIGGSMLAGQAIAAGLVDELRLYVLPTIIGGGKRALPSDVRALLRLVDERRFANGAVYLDYLLQPSS